MRIAISGEPYSGKTTVTKELERFGFRRLTSATRPKVENQGTRTCDNNYWVTPPLASVSDYGPAENLVIDDFRFPDEAVALQTNGFLLVRLDCSTEVRRARARLLGRKWEVQTTSDRTDPLHGTSDNPETVPDKWPAWDYRINSAVPKSQLERAVRHMLGHFLEVTE